MSVSWCVFYVIKSVMLVCTIFYFETSLRVFSCSLLYFRSLEDLIENETGSDFKYQFYSFQHSSKLQNLKSAKC